MDKQNQARADPSGGVVVANINLCDSSTITLGAGDEVIVTYGSVEVEVVSGVVEATFVTNDGTLVTTELYESANLIFDPSLATFVNTGKSDAIIVEIVNTGEADTVVVVDDVEYTIPVGNVWFAAVLELNPEVLNLKSNGEWITAYIELSSSYDVTAVDVSSIKLQIEGYYFGVDLLAPTGIGDHDGDGVSDLMVKFQRLPITVNLMTIDSSSVNQNFYEVESLVSGLLSDGNLFGCSDTLIILNSKK